jgi:hypothetical protein
MGLALGQFSTPEQVCRQPAAVSWQLLQRHLQQALVQVLLLLLWVWQMQG